MKATLLRLFILPGGIAWLVGMSLLSLILIHSPLPPSSFQAQGDRNEFPGQRRGGGTHWTVTPDHVA